MQWRSSTLDQKWMVSFRIQSLLLTFLRGRQTVRFFHFPCDWIWWCIRIQPKSLRCNDICYFLSMFLFYPPAIEEQLWDFFNFHRTEPSVIESGGALEFNPSHCFVMIALPWLLTSLLVLQFSNPPTLHLKSGWAKTPIFGISELN